MPARPHPEPWRGRVTSRNRPARQAASGRRCPRAPFPPPTAHARSARPPSPRDPGPAAAARACTARHPARPGPTGPGWPPPPGGPPAAAVPDSPHARHAAALTARQALTGYAAALADAASGQRAFLPAAGPADPAVLAAASHDLIDQLAALAAATQQTARDLTQPQRPPRRQRAAVTAPLFSPPQET
jgi:hypothetical protein